jgi:hypothetical protein
MGNESPDHAVRWRSIEPGDQTRVAAVIDEWWGGRALSGRLSHVFFVHFRPTSFVVESSDELLGFLLAPPRSDSRRSQKPSWATMVRSACEAGEIGVRRQVLPDIILTPGSREPNHGFADLIWRLARGSAEVVVITRRMRRRHRLLGAYVRVELEERGVPSHEGRNRSQAEPPHTQAQAERTGGDGEVDREDRPA